MKEVSIDVQTGEKSTRDFTAEEIEQIKEIKEIEKAVNDNTLAKLAAKNALFVKLGITQDEAKLLLG
jgi:hypothetical protein